jgi:hypothetical protein
MTTLARSAICLVLAALTGCSPTTGDKPDGEQKPLPLDPILYADRVTGCEYLGSRDDHGITPRIAADGKTHMGCKGAQP